MRELNKEELTMVSGGEVICTIGTLGIWCQGSVKDWAELAKDAYDGAVESVADFYQWVDETVTGDDSDSDSETEDK